MLDCLARLGLERVGVIGKDASNRSRRHQGGEDQRKRCRGPSVGGAEVTVATLKRRTAKALELQPLDASQAEHTMAPSDVGWIARIVWASQ